MQKQPDMTNLIKEASTKLGMSSQELQQQLQSGKLDALMKNLTPAQAKGVQQAMNNPELAKKMLQSPQVQQMMKNMLNNK